MTESNRWEIFELDEIFDKLDTSEENGITDDEAQSRLEKYGENKLKEESGVSLISILLDQFKSILIVVLILAALLSAYTAWLESEPFTEAYVILFIVLMNAVLGFIQEYRAEKAVEALKEMITQEVLVIRDGKEKIINSEKIVPGDIILLEAGGRVSADSRIIKSYNLQVDEAVLTGESVPVSKLNKTAEKPTEDPSNMVFMGTTISSGRAIAVVVNTGMSTRFGEIAELVQAVETEAPPLKKKVEKMGRKLALISVVLISWVFIIGYFILDIELIEIFLVAVSLGVSAIPEGLPAVLTITLALGVNDMAKHNAIVRKLSSVETLGSTTVICSDKTGTITKNEMTVTKIILPNREIEVTGTGYTPKGEVRENNEEVTIENELEFLIKIGILCNSSELIIEQDKINVVGDRTEAALLTLGEKVGLKKEELKKTNTLIDELPFDSNRKMMSSIYKDDEGKTRAYIKGAPEIILDKSNKIFLGNNVEKLEDENKKEYYEEVQNLAEKALRVLAFGYKDVPEQEDYEQESVEEDIIFVGLVGMIDPPRDGVAGAVETARKAGVKTVMVTGDFLATAKAIAQQVGIINDTGDKHFTGENLTAMDDAELDAVITEARVFARVSPNDKVRIAESYRRLGEIVAMTGDGVNDAPAIKTADIGIAMGIKGTDVSREASDMILEDDNYATIVDAIKRGRMIFDNITKYIRLMLAANFDEFLLITVAISLGMPLPLLPIHILWINLITDGLPALALSVDPPQDDVMMRPPRDPNEGILDRFWLFIIAAALLAFIISFSVFWYSLTYLGEIIKARSMLMTSIVFFELVLAFQTRSDKYNVLELGLDGFIGNKYLAISFIVSVLIQLGLLNIPLLYTTFNLSPLSITELGVCALAGLAPLLLIPRWFIKEVTSKVKLE